MTESRSEDRAIHLRSVLSAALVFLVLLLTVAGVKSFRDLAAARSYEEQLQQRLEDSRGRIDDLERRIEHLRDDPPTLETLAREEGLVQPGDLVILLPREEAFTEPEPDPRLPEIPPHPEP